MRAKNKNLRNIFKNIIIGYFRENYIFDIVKEIRRSNNQIEMLSVPAIKPEIKDCRRARTLKLYQKVDFTENYQFKYENS